ncbi:retrovirus-related pol polyprotein from transposon TNT 1-94 [Tanacetum coccineum]|uniref:Retrovirus-related pol polyprotein from transposon TNT 1-94 n=1 Tax=Tanacetum coccineum TaxID=301880 RepID=A0ABQ5E828_9ASTR
MDKCKTRLGYNVVSPPYTRNFMPPKPDLVYPSIYDFVDVNESVSESVVQKPTVETNEPKTGRKENGAPIIEDWVSESEEQDEAKTRVNTARPKAVLSAVKGNNGNAIKASACWGNPQQDLKDKGVIDSGCSRHMTGNRSYLTDYEDIDGGFVAFGDNSKGGKIIKKVPRKDNMYSVDLKNVVPQGGLTCLFAKATLDESNLWHRRLGYVNFKTMNKVVKENLVRVYGCADDPNIPNLEEIGRFSDAEDDGVDADMTNLDTHILVSPIPTTRIHKDHLIEQIIGDLNSAPQTRRMTQNLEEHEGNPSIEGSKLDRTMQDELLQFKFTKVWDCWILPNGKRAIGTKQVYKNKKDERGVVIKNKARLVAWGKIEEEVYVYQPPGFEDPDFPDKVYKLEKALYGLQQAPKAWYETLSTYLLDNGFQRGKIDKTLFIKREKGASLDRMSQHEVVNSSGCGIDSWANAKKLYLRIIHKGWLEWNAKAAKDGNGVKMVLRVNRCGHYLVLHGQKVKFLPGITLLMLEPIFVPSSSQPKKTHRPRKAKRATKISQSSGPISLVANKTVTKEREDRMERDATTASSLKAERDSGNINRTQSMATLNEPSPQGTGSGSGPRVNTLRSGEDRLKLKELMNLYTKLSDRVLDLETTKTAQAKEIASLKKRDKKLERKRKSKTPGMNLFKIDMDEVFKDVEGDAEQVISATADEVPTGDAVNTVGNEVNTASALVTTAGVSVSTAKPITTGSVNITTAIVESASPKTKGVVMQETSETTTTTTTTTIPSKDKGKGIMVEEPLKMKKNDQVLFDEQEAIKLQAQFDEEERITREKEEDNASLIAQWNDIQDMVETDYELAQRLQAEEQEELTIEEKSKLFQQLLDKRRKNFATKKAEERRNRPHTKAQQRSIMCTYLENMAGWKPKDLKTNEVRAEGSETMRGEAVSTKSSDEARTRPLMKEVVVDAIPLATKPLSIVDRKIIKEGNISYYQIIRADGNSKRYSSMIQMLKSFDREDLETLWKLVKAKHG